MSDPYCAESTAIPKIVIDQLGKVSDRQLERDFGVSVYRLKLLRKQLGITQFAVSKKPPEEMVKLLGSVTDRSLGNRFGWSSGAIMRLRIRLGIPRFYVIPDSRPSVISPTLPLGMLEKLGVMPDTEVGRLFRWSPEKVGNTRRRLAIPVYKEASATLPPKYLTKYQLSLMHEFSSEEVTKQILESLKDLKELRGSMRIDPTQSALASWPDEVRILLGTDSDTAIGNLIGISTRSVLRARKALGIAPFIRSHSWTAENVALLGCATDKQTAHILGLSKHAIKTKREALGIPRFNIWTDAYIDLLGYVADDVIVEMMNGAICRAEVIRKRQSLDRPAFDASSLPLCRPKPMLWTDESKSFLGTDWDLVIAKKLGVTATVVQKARARFGVPPYKNGYNWTSADLELLRKATDTEVAKHLSISASAVRWKRKELRLPHPSSWDGVDLTLLGQIPDSEFSAGSAGRVKEAAVRRKRIKLGIPCWKDSLTLKELKKV